MASQHQTHAARKPDIWTAEQASRLLRELGNKGSDSDRNTQSAMGLDSQPVSRPSNQKASQPDSCFKMHSQVKGTSLEDTP